MKKLILASVILFSIVLSVYSCKEDCNSANVRGYVKHHSEFIPNARVFIKKGATEFPGTDTSLYDQRIQADSINGFYKVESLEEGNYYFFGLGYDTAIAEPVLAEYR